LFLGWHVHIPVTQIRECGIQLYQLSSGLDGLSSANRTKVEGTEEAVQSELKEVFGRMRGEGDERLRKNMADVMRESVERGEAKEGMMLISQWFGANR